MKKTLLSALLTIGIAGSAHALYLPSGPQTNVALSTVTSGGWTQCYASAMGTAIGNQAQNVLNACTGDYLMMAGRETGSADFLVLAAAERAETIFNTGGGDNTHLANGANWYYTDNWSWGYTAANDSVALNSCDISDSPTSMCLHTLDVVGGYRINNIAGLNGSTDYEKVFFTASRAAVVPEPASLMLFGLGMGGLVLNRRRKAARA
jgi:hypothetical protein